jgi:ribosomal protein S18 acetylase RimI-like enzyme
MSFSVRRLGPGDEPILELLAREDGDFDVEGRPASRQPLDRETERAYLSDPAVLHWVAEDRGAVLGALSAHLLRKRVGAATEVLLYEIGVRAAHRRRRIGQALVEALYGWMRAHGVREVWVLAGNPAAVEFYRACGFEIPAGPAVYLQRRLDLDPTRPSH